MDCYPPSGGGAAAALQHSRTLLLDVARGAGRARRMSPLDAIPPRLIRYGAAGVIGALAVAAPRCSKEASMAEAYILDAVRTPRGKGKRGKGALTEIHPQELLAQTLQQLARHAGISPADVEDVVIGCLSQVGEQGAD